ncbi:MAG: DsrE family protein [bacterium]
MALQIDHPAVQVNFFLMADAVSDALRTENVPQGYFNIERMLKSILSQGGKVNVCGIRTDARGIRNIPLVG